MRLKELRKRLRLFSGKGAGLFRQVFRLAVIAVIVLGMTYNNSDYFYSRYGLFYQFICTFLLFAGVIYLNMYLLVPRLLLKEKLTAYILSVALYVLFTLVSFAFIQTAFSCFHDERESYEIGINIFGTLISIALIIFATSVYPLFYSISKYRQRNNEIETTAIDMELQQLKNQINPHFLFNTLNNANIKTEKDPVQASAIIRKLADLLRYQLMETAKSKVRLKSEIGFLSRYLELEQIRRERFSYSLTVANDVPDAEIPPLLFITFVENAVKYSLSPRGESHIAIAFTMGKDKLRFYCENTKPAVPVPRKAGGLGLKNIRRRLDLLYGHDYSLDISETDKMYSANLDLKI